MPHPGVALPAVRERKLSGQLAEGERLASFEDIRRLFEDHAQGHRAELERLRGLLDDFLSEARARALPQDGGLGPVGVVGGGGGQVVSSAPTCPDRLRVPDELHDVGAKSSVQSPMSGCDEKPDHLAAFSMAPLGSTASMLRGVQAARFDMAKALGFDGVDETAELKPTERSEAAHGTVFGKSKTRKKLGLKASSSFISTSARKRTTARLTSLQRFVHSTLFENLTGGVVCVNAIVIGAHANVRALHPEQCFPEWETVFLIFNCFFTLELIIRMYVYRWAFLFGPDKRWNYFDSAIVFAGVLEDVAIRSFGHMECGLNASASGSESSLITGITVLRILRALRMVRIIKAIRTMSIFKDLRIMVASTLRCLVPLAWACLLLGFIKWCFSVYFLHLATDHISQAINEFGIEVLSDSSQPYMELRNYFGSLWLSIFTLFQSITGGIDWEIPCNALYSVTNAYHPLVFYAIFIALTLFAVLNVITGVFVENATQVALRDRELMIQSALSDRDRYKDALSEVFREADIDGSGQLTATEFAAHLEDPRVQAFLATLEIDSMGAQRMFRLLDLDGDGLVSSEDFVTGCMCLKGGAKTIDVAALLLEVNKMSSKISASIARLEQRLPAASTSVPMS